MNEWDQLQRWILNPPHTIDATTPMIKRLVQAVRDGATTKDLAILIRSVIRLEEERSGGNNRAYLRVPRSARWPSITQYAEVGVGILSEDEETYLLFAVPWSPKWLPHEQGQEPDRPLFAMKNRSHLQSVEGDPYLSEVGRQRYRSASQRDATRTILTSPDDSTLLINLPTGMGKSLCGQLPAMLFSRQEGVTVVVVPTTALALDQERALMPLLNRPTAYFASPSRKVENEAIKASIQDGTQRVVFTSPESVLHTLNYSLQIAAERGYFRMLVIDEAHIIDSWGEGFRPAFQQLAGWRRMMQRQSLRPFRTLLLSATVTKSCMDTLETLFGSPGLFDAFSAVALRPEPAYWMARCYDDAQKMEWLFEALHHLPRPLIVYTTQIQDTIDIGKMIKEIGYTRVKTFHGDTKLESREEIIEAWSRGTLDIVVATSAFGLGVDQADVRAVIHACVPESIDRFYQEVGRGGRDGNASLSLLLYNEEDYQRGVKMSAAQLIGIDKGRPRWNRMFSNKQAVPGEADQFRVPVTISPGTEPGRIDKRNDYNEQWNLRTLTLLARMGVLAFDWEEIGKQDGNREDNWRIIRMLKHDHMDDSFWDQVDEYRLNSKRADRAGFRLMTRLLRGNECIAGLFKEIYSIPGEERADMTWRREVTVAPACGGCPACRAVSAEPNMPMSVSYPIEWPTANPVTYLLRRYLDAALHKLVLFRKDDAQLIGTAQLRNKNAMLRTIRWFVAQGIVHVVASPTWLQAIKADAQLANMEVVFTSPLNEYITGLMRVKWQVPTLVIYEERDMDGAIHRWMQAAGRQDRPIVFMIPEAMPHPTRNGQLLADTLTIRSYRYEVFKQEVGI